ncbi:hypothetical protein FDB79_01980 [Clostridium botulinum]|nr:hypothetical protein [Clostridium botulinum]
MGLLSFRLFGVMFLRMRRASKMRRCDRAITEFDDIVKVMKACKVCNVAFHDDEYPYVVPMTFGLEVKDNEEVSIYLS